MLHFILYNILSRVKKIVLQIVLTVSGFASLGDDKGSLFIQALCKVLSEWGTEREIMAILTRVNHMVAYELEYKAKEPALDHMKQTPSIVSQLTKRLYFPLKQTVKWSICLVFWSF